ncbi:hypothetical protein PR003_g5073 [Phytophthora rubi]|uniref:Uncharacterized protein n=1 Tax=Phytophthora rubi TaxID=129364 RepID=A0A6A4FKH1_9STRA|nr:hypothetical protein PR002_g5171 [Phytophthora rubi]KAE9045872.1 hypothetical protein PR001_g4789 [Phytophthora rubi]KAE9351019.1 hypothetical protein PR003_g5073 [Phytophthora rubi]
MRLVAPRAARTAGVEYRALQSTRTQQNLALQARLQACQGLRFTLEAQDSAAEEAPASFARIGTECKTSQAPRSTQPGL